MLIPTMSENMDEQLPLAHKMVDVVDRANGEICVICVTLLRYIEDKPESFNAQIGNFARKKEDEKFQLVIHVKKNFEEFIYLLNVMNSV